MIKDYFKIDKNPKKGLLPLEWAMLGYMAITVITMLFAFTKVVNPESMLWGRLRILVITLALWGVYRMIPCRITKMVRIMAQIALLAWWYPDTYEINRMFPNLDHIFAGWEQDLFGCQPALLFAKAMPWAVVSELMSMGYFMYYPMIAAVVLYYFFCRYYEAERASFVLLASFFLYYLIYIYVPVVAPSACSLPGTAETASCSSSCCHSTPSCAWPPCISRHIISSMPSPDGSLPWYSISC